MFKGTAKNRAASIKNLPNVITLAGIEAITTGAMGCLSQCYSSNK